MSLDVDSELKPTKHGAARVGISMTLAQERLKRLRLQNKKLALDQREREGTLVDRQEFMNQVLAANHIVKQHLLAVIERAEIPPDSRVRLRQQMIDALNELAYERGHTHTAG